MYLCAGQYIYYLFVGKFLHFEKRTGIIGDCTILILEKYFEKKRKLKIKMKVKLKNQI